MDEGPPCRLQHYIAVIRVRSRSRPIETATAGIAAVFRLEVGVTRTASASTQGMIIYST